MGKTGKMDGKDQANDQVEPGPKKLAKLVEGPDPVSAFIDALRVGPDFALGAIDPRSAPGYQGDKEQAQLLMDAAAAEIDDLQQRLYANGRDGDGPSVLLVVQGMDTSGKGGVMRHVVGLCDPQGIQLHAFKAPNAEEKKHPFLWRVRPHVPAPGMIGVFDRSHYEDVLIARVHNLVPPRTWSRRYAQIINFEESVARKGTHIIKVMLHISRDEQQQRLQARLDRPDKWWKFNPGDIDERELWPAYQEAYEVALQRTSTDAAPWYCVPADRKWYARLAVQHILLAELRALGLNWPTAAFDVAEQKERLAST